MSESDSAMWKALFEGEPVADVAPDAIGYVNATFANPPVPAAAAVSDEAPQSTQTRKRPHDDEEEGGGDAPPPLKRETRAEDIEAMKSALSLVSADPQLAASVASTMGTQTAITVSDVGSTAAELASPFNPENPNFAVFVRNIFRNKILPNLNAQETASVRGVSRSLRKHANENGAVSVKEITRMVISPDLCTPAMLPVVDRFLWNVSTTVQDVRIFMGAAMCAPDPSVLCSVVSKVMNVFIDATKAPRDVAWACLSDISSRVPWEDIDVEDMDAIVRRVNTVSGSTTRRTVAWKLQMRTLENWSVAIGGDRNPRITVDVLFTLGSFGIIPRFSDGGASGAAYTILVSMRNRLCVHHTTEIDDEMAALQHIVSTVSASRPTDEGGLEPHLGSHHMNRMFEKSLRFLVSEPCLPPRIVDVLNVDASSHARSARSLIYGAVKSGNVALVHLMADRYPNRGFAKDQHLQARLVKCALKEARSHVTFSALVGAGVTRGVPMYKTVCDVEDGGKTKDIMRMRKTFNIFFSPRDGFYTSTNLPKILDKVRKKTGCDYGNDKYWNLARSIEVVRALWYGEKDPPFVLRSLFSFPQMFTLVETIIEHLMPRLTVASRGSSVFYAKYGDTKLSPMTYLDLHARMIFEVRDYIMVIAPPSATTRWLQNEEKVLLHTESIIVKHMRAYNDGTTAIRKDVGSSVLPLGDYLWNIIHSDSTPSFHSMGWFDVSGDTAADARRFLRWCGLMKHSTTWKPNRYTQAHQIYKEITGEECPHNPPESTEDNGNGYAPLIMQIIQGFIDKSNIELTGAEYLFTKFDGTFSVAFEELTDPEQQYPPTVNDTLREIIVFGISCYDGAEENSIFKALSDFPVVTQRVPYVTLQDTSFHSAEYLARKKRITMVMVWMTSSANQEAPLTMFEFVVRRVSFIVYGALAGLALAVSMNTRDLIPVHTFSRKRVHLAGPLSVLCAAYSPYSLATATGLTKKFEEFGDWSEDSAGETALFSILFVVLVLVLGAILILSWLGVPSFLTYRYKDGGLKARGHPRSRIIVEFVIALVLLVSPHALWLYLFDAWSSGGSAAVTIVTEFLVWVGVWYVFNTRHKANRVYFVRDQSLITWHGFVLATGGVHITSAIAYAIAAEFFSDGLAAEILLIILTAWAVVVAAVVWFWPIPLFRSTKRGDARIVPSDSSEESSNSSDARSTFTSPEVIAQRERELGI